MTSLLIPKPLAIAIAFMTTLPVRYPPDATATDQRQALYWYPLVGLIIGILLWLGAWVLPQGTWLSAGLLLGLWIALTGALHLDGLADCADAWMGGLGDRERTLRIMKDPNAGAIAVVTLILVLLLKLVAIQQLVAAGNAAFLIALPVMARVSPLILFVTTPYVRSNGIGAVLRVDHHEQRLQYIIYLAVAIFILLCLGFTAIGMIIASLLVVWLIIRATVARLGGFTGDVAGATIELLELTGCVYLALLLSAAS